MRLHRLTMTAFGPFRSKQVVDFDALSDAGLFLLTGHTGAGKTSVLDAVTYALYGQVPGTRASTSRVRSDHADPVTPTCVELELTVRGARLRVRRTPDWERPKRRGVGMTREKGSVLLERDRSGSWDVVSHRHDEVGHELTCLLGLTKDQFCQVVLLPQGAFASFLHADAESRRRLLEQLFGTERFAVVEGWLSALRSASGEAYEQQLDRRGDLVVRLAEVSDDRDSPDRDATDETVLAWADAVLGALGGQRSHSDRRAGAAAAAMVDLESALSHAREVESRQRRLRALRDRERQVVAAEPRRRAAGSELAAATRALALRPLVETVDEAMDALAAVTISVEVERAAIRRQQVPADGDDATLRHRERDLRAELTRLDDLSVDGLQLVELHCELAVTRQRLAASAAENDAHLTALAVAPAVRDRLDRQLLECAFATQRLPEVEQELARALGRVTAAETRDQVTRLKDIAREARDGAAAAVLEARSQLLDVRERRLDGMAAELAATLRSGIGCPVCGSVEHPQPAQQSGLVGEAAERAARAALEVAEAAAEAADDRVRVLAEQLAAAQVAASGDQPLTQLQAVAHTHLAYRDQTAELAAALPAAEAALRSHDNDLRHRGVAQRVAQDAVSAGAGRVAQLQTQHAELESRIASARGDDADLASRTSRLAAAADALAATGAALVEEAQLRRAVRAAERRLATAAHSAGFKTAAAVAVALRPEARMAELADFVADHDREVDLLRSALADPDLSTLSPEPVTAVSSRLAAAERTYASGVEALAAAQAERGRLEAAHRKALVLHGDIVGAVTRLAPLRREFDQVDALARLASGTGSDNKLRMRLSYYVLSARLEQVAAAASERLLRMSDGRFTLRHTDERSSGNQRSGLGLQVCDSWYGTTRDPASLSGGETFMASLALALGLADVVVAEAGGTLMDTLFVDEGFGSLDDHTLDAVLDVLDGLREGGRVVGLVSHVSELRDRIPTQLAVGKATFGSSLRITA